MYSEIALNVEAQEVVPGPTQPESALTWLFFREHDIAKALVDLILLWIVIGAETVIFWRMQQLAAWLMAP